MTKSSVKNPSNAYTFTIILQVGFDMRVSRAGKWESPYSTLIDDKRKQFF